MRFSYRLIKDARGYLAECMEIELAGEGKTVRDAVESLRGALEERMFRADAVAPPSTSIVANLELVLTDDGSDKLPALNDVSVGARASA